MVVGAEKPVIAYVDEQEDARADFLTDAHLTDFFGEVVTLDPSPQLEDMLARLFELPIDALVSDFRLTEAGPVGYDGTELVTAFAEARKGFPCFIQTSYDQEALQTADDVNRIYSKNSDVEGGGRSNFFERIALQANRYRAKVVAWGEELAELSSVAPEELSAAQIERIVELDNALEQIFGADDAMPAGVKRSTLDAGGLANRQTELLDQTEKLIADIKASLDDAA